MDEIREAFVLPFKPKPHPLTLGIEKEMIRNTNPEAAVEPPAKRSRTQEVLDLWRRPDAAANVAATVPVVVTITTTTATTTTAPAPTVPKIPRNKINDWPGLRTLVENGIGVKSVTAVDPGTRNLAVMRMEFTPAARITHIKVWDLDELCKEYEATNPHMRLGGGGTIEPRMYVLEKAVARECERGGCFASDMLLCEDQSFDRIMARVEATIVSTFNARRPAIRVTTTSEIPAGQIFDSRSVKACYRPLYPKLAGGGGGDDDDDDDERIHNDNNSSFGIGQAHANQRNNKQREENKRNAKKYGSMICPQARLAEIVPNLTDSERKRLLKGQMHDVYDCLFACCYWASCYLFHFYKLRRDEPNAVVGPFAKPKQRPRNRWQELIEIASDLGTPKSSIDTLFVALEAHLKKAQAAAPV